MAAPGAPPGDLKVFISAAAAGAAGILDWTDPGACRDHPAGGGGLFVDDLPERAQAAVLATARAVRADCPVRAECAERCRAICSWEHHTPQRDRRRRLRGQP